MNSLALRLLPVCLSLLIAGCDEARPLLPANATLPDGGQYRGEIVDGLLQGPGRLDYRNGSWFVGQFKDGMLEGSGEWQGPGGEHYLGEFHEGMFHGQGTLTYSDGSRYEGGFERNRFSGVGLLEQGGQRYQGKFLNDRFHGLGKLEMADGSSFQGQFVKGQPEGQGVRIDAYGNQYSGVFAQGLLSGQGSYHNADGDNYSGGFKNDEFHGKGRYQSAGGETWAGEFVEGVMQGPGEYTDGEGTRYLGEFADWQYEGEGLLTLPDGSAYRGHFSGGEYSGEGTLTLADGSRQSGTWQSGRLVRDEQGQPLPDSLELGLLQQGQLLEEAIAAIPTSTPSRELYALTLAGDGKQSVFMREADYVSRLMRDRFGAYGSVSLINHRDHLADRPLATRENLTRVVQALAERSGEEDLIFIYLTSHGSRHHELNLDQPRLQLADLPASELAALLAPLKQRDKVVVISACYSGGFIPPLKDEKTLVMTAARADRVSFGCSEENDFTYFGRALFAEALGETDNLERAFELAKERVAEREQSDGFEPSEPQIWAPRGVLQHWRELRQSQAERALGAVASGPAKD
ncbi:C13 family peptidase [Pseudomonas sediminis]|uniref:C13 family peptidase n=1 Tax=Pseudomonas sediminis TaxID=1691904 RepID=UPI0031CC3CC5